MARRRRSSRRHSRALGMYHSMRSMRGFSFDTAQIHWGAVGAGVIAGAALAYYWMKPKPSSSSSSMQGLGMQAAYVGRSRTEAWNKCMADGGRVFTCGSKPKPGT